MPNITAPTFDSYAAFKASVWYDKVMARNGVEYIVYDETQVAGVTGAVLPITKGEGVSWSTTMEKIEVDEWGKTVIEEFADGKARISGSIGIFYSQKNADTLPNTQDFAGRRFRIVKQVAEGYPGAGIALSAVVGVALNQKDYQGNVRGAMRYDIRFLASREYNGDEIEAGAL